MAIEQWMRDGVLEELGLSADIGETRSRAQLQEAIGLGSGDLSETLDELRTAGRISEVAPDSFAPADDVAPAPEAGATPAVEPDEQEDARRRLRTPMTGAETAAWQTTGATVTMPRAMVDALEAPALGSLLKAGIEASPDGFVFEVTP